MRDVCKIQPVQIKYIPSLKNHPKLEDFKHLTIPEARDKYILFISEDEMAELAKELEKIKLWFERAV